MIRQIQLAQLEQGCQMVCIADSRDGLALYNTFRKHKNGKLKIRLAAVTPFAEALNPMAFNLI